MKLKIYNFLVNKTPGIAYRYHSFHDGKAGAANKIASYLYLLWLNFAYYVLFMKFLGRVPQMDVYEKKSLITSSSESAACLSERECKTVEELVAKTEKYEVVSFDVFDTLIFRPFSAPTDVFYLVGEKLGVSNFKNLRMLSEWEARQKCQAEKGHMEVTLAEIWDELEQKTGCDKEIGMQAEIDAELSLCCANPFMMEVWNRLTALNKRIVITSDMYLPETVIRKIVENAGFCGAEMILVSSEIGLNKASGSIWNHLKKKLGTDSIIHIGDNPASDYKIPKANGVEAVIYPNINKYSRAYRAEDMSPVIGGAYRGVVNNRVYNGLEQFSMEYEYGFIYGGLFVLGYCSFIHDYCKKNGVDCLMFLSRDGDILKQAYDRLYSDENTHYAYWSRKAATKLMAKYDRYDYLRRFIDHKVNQNYRLADIFHSMEMDGLMAKALEKLNFTEETLLTDKNSAALKAFFAENWQEVLEAYGIQNEAAKKYYEDLLGNSKNAGAVDIGWAGSGALTLSYLTEKAWEIPCRITGIIAGTNTIHNAEADASEAFLQSGKLVSYLYSQSFNRDVMKKHNPNRDYNVYWELLLSSPTPQFDGFGFEGGEIKMNFGKYDVNQEGIKDIQKGILDFVSDYVAAFKDYPYMLNISGRDAYAPMLVAASDDEKYLKVIKGKFDLKINVD